MRLKVEEEAKLIKYKDKDIINAAHTYSITGEKKFSVVVGFNQSDIPEKDLEKLKSTFKTELLSLLTKENSTIKEIQYISI
jgi:hypothetical protein